MKNVIEITGNGVIAAALVLVTVFALTGELSAQAGSGEKSGTESAKAEKTVEQTVCPVMDGKIDKALFVDFNGKRIYVCCEGCIDILKADPAKYIKKLETQEITLATTQVLQTVCPVMDSKINKAMYVDFNGKRVYVCCEGCIDKVKADPAKYIKKLEAQGITVARTPGKQTLCPVAGTKIDKAVYVDVDGKRIYLCCKGCGATIKADPSKYIGKLESEGVILEKVTAK